MARGKTIPELRWPDTPDFLTVAQAWQHDATAILLGFVWRGYDLLCSEVTYQINMALVNENLERSISQLLEPRIRRVMSGDEPFFIQHGSFEEESRYSPQAQPPQYDLAFVLRAYERVKWPLEAKVCRTDASVSEYVKSVREQFLKCRYAPFSSEGAMVAYLLAGNPGKLFALVAEGLACSLEHHPRFTERPHKTSDHIRSVPADKKYPRAFRCHHIVLQFGAVHGPPCCQ